MSKKITQWEPEDFELETNTVWSFPDRGKWATHDAKYRGNWSPYIPRNVILRYSEEGDLVLDQFAGGGTTLVEAKLLGRDIIGVDINPDALERCKEKCDFERENCGKVYIKSGDARNLDFVPDESIDLICTLVSFKSASVLGRNEKGCSGKLSRVKTGKILCHFDGRYSTKRAHDSHEL